MDTIDIKDCDVVFLSYDEPNSEENWQHLQSHCARALRVHGVRGSDSAHKACARLAATERVCVIDGDNWVDPRLFGSSWCFPEGFDVTGSVLSFPAENSVNGLEYGNGGIKIWPRAVVLGMRTHELAQDDQGGAGLDFCWTLDYVLMPQTFSETRINHSPAQAWRSGFREGVKMAIVDGVWIRDPQQWHDSIAKINLRRLETWLQVGSDVCNGLWAILGARQGLSRVMLEGWDPRRVHDFTVLDHIWCDTVKPLGDPFPEIQRLGAELQKQLGIAVTADPLTAAQSQWFRHWLKWQGRKEPKRLRT